jgi:hypothetical protein
MQVLMTYHLSVQKCSRFCLTHGIRLSALRGYNRAVSCVKEVGSGQLAVKSISETLPIDRSLLPTASCFTEAESGAFGGMGLFGEAAPDSF